MAMLSVKVLMIIIIAMMTAKMCRLVLFWHLGVVFRENSHNNCVVSLWWSLFYMCDSSGSKRLSHLPQRSKLVSDRLEL